MSCTNMNLIYVCIVLGQYLFVSVSTCVSTANIFYHAKLDLMYKEA